MFQFCDNKTCFLALMLKVAAALYPSRQLHSLSLIKGNVGALSQDPNRWEGSHRRICGISFHSFEVNRDAPFDTVSDVRPIRCLRSFSLANVLV